MNDRGRNQMTVGQLVEPKMGSLGTGVIVGTRDDLAYVYFKTQDTPQAKKFRFAALQPSATESDPELQALKFNGDAMTGFTLVRRAKTPRAKKVAEV
jgi:hypothetical protein